MHNAVQHNPQGHLARDAMYYQYFGLTEAPFSIAVNPRYLFMSPRHRDALAHLLYGVGAGGGFILLTGEVGTGKTTINRCLLEQLPQDTDIAIILNPALNAMELLASACDELGIGYDPHRHTLKTLTDKLHIYLLENHSRGRKTVLLIDEAQHLDFDVLEQIRLLTNLETNSEKLLQIILIGQPELAEMLSRPELRQLNQRITARYNLEPLSQEETGAYIHHRLQVAGMSPERVIFPPSVVKRIHKSTRGIPRVINVLCDRVLLGAYGRNKSRADSGMVDLAVEEVLGQKRQDAGPWRSIALVAVVLLASLLAWWLLRPQNTLLQIEAAVAPPVPPPVATTPAIEPEPELAPEPKLLAHILPEPVTPAVAPRTNAGNAGSPAVMSRALLPPQQSRARLWSLYSPEPVPDNPCPKALHHGLTCVEGQAQTWDELVDLDRPLSLAVVTPERFSAEVLLLGMEGRSAWVWTGEEVAAVELAELAPLWSGAYRFLWHPPAGFQQPLARGDEGETVASVAALFARLDEQPVPLAGKVFNANLEHRVSLFQRQHGLVDDGVVGVQTLLKLNEQLGIDPSAARARAQLTAQGQGIAVEGAGL